MNWLEVLLDGLLMTAITLGASLWGGSLFKNCGFEVSEEGGICTDQKALRRFAVLIYGICIVFTIGRVFLAYEGQENSDFFFWHPYLAWLLSDVLWILVKRGSLGKSGLLQRIFLWPLVVIPVFSGLSLSIGWLLKLYLRYFLPYKY